MPESLIAAPGLDTWLARTLLLRGRLDYPRLATLVERARAERSAAGRTLAQLLVAEGLLAADEVERELCQLVSHQSLPAASQPWELGSEIDQFQLVRQLGSGGMGTVYLARDPRTGAEVAIKGLSLGADPELLLRFQREGEAQARVDAHPNVIRVHSAGHAKGRAYIVMDVALGGDLEDRIRRGPLPPEEAATVTLSLARGLAFAHDRGVLHRDLKPANILFDERGTPRLVDFGLARLADAESLTQSGQVMGTPSFMAPEQARGEPVDARADVYGLGAVLYAALTGRPPFSAGSVLATLMLVTKGPPTPPRDLEPDVPLALEAICLRALAKAPGDRQPSATALAEELERFLAGEDAPRRRAPIVKALVVAGALLAVATALALSARPNPRPSAKTEPTARANERVDPPQAEDPKRALAKIQALRRGQERLEAAEAWLRRHGEHRDAIDARTICREKPWLSLSQPKVRGATFVGPSADAILAWGYDGQAFLYDARGGGELDSWPSRFGWSAGAASTSGRLLALGNVEGGVWLIERASGERVGFWRLDGVAWALAFTADEDALLAAGSKSLRRARVLRPPNRARPVGPKHRGPVESLAILPGDRVASVGGTVDIPGTCEAYIWNVSDGSVQRRLGNFANRPNAVAYVPTRQAILIGDATGALTLIDANRVASPLARFEGEPRPLSTSLAHSARVSAVAAHPSGRLYSASAGSAGSESDLRVWDAETGAQTDRALVGARGQDTLSISPDGRRLLVCSLWAARIEVWLCAAFHPLAPGPPTPLLPPAPPRDPEVLSEAAWGVWEVARRQALALRRTDPKRDQRRYRESLGRAHGAYRLLVGRLLVRNSRRWLEARAELAKLPARSIPRLGPAPRPAEATFMDHGQSLMRERLFYRALRVHEEAVRAKHTRTHAHTRMGQILRRMGDPGGSVLHLRRAAWLAEQEASETYLKMAREELAKSRAHLRLQREAPWEPRSEVLPRHRTVVAPSDEAGD